MPFLSSVLFFGGLRRIRQSCGVGTGTFTILEKFMQYYEHMFSSSQYNQALSLLEIQEWEARFSANYSFY